MNGKGRRENQLPAAVAREIVQTPSGELAEIFLEHHSRVFRAAYRITGSATDAEDVLQTVFLRLMRPGWRADGIGDLGSYLHRAAVNGALDLVRAQRESRSVPLEAVAPRLLQDSRLQPDRRQDARELRAFLREAIARLAPKAAEIFALRYFEGCSNPEIAGMLGVSENDVAVTLHRSRSRLQEEIRSFLERHHEH
jgi:RNA polymerase sigma-70 factor (ECF subfamily)